MMKNFLLGVMTALLFSAGSIAQTPNPDTKDNLVFLLRNQEHINQAIKTIGQLYNQTSEINPGNIEIIVCGQAVSTLITPEAEAWAKDLSKYPNASLLACGLSLKKFGIPKEKLAKGIKYTKNGFIRTFELQKQGYLSVEL